MKATTSLYRPGVPGLIPDAWIVNPDKTQTMPAVVAVHGITRGTEEMVAHLLPRARETGRTLVVPLFDKDHWPRYQRAACKNRADWALIRLMSALRVEGQISPQPFDLSGFSGGAQFSHRFAWLYPALVGRLCLTAPGWWTMPDTSAAWPYGIGASPADKGQGFQLQANMRRFLDRQITVCVGSDDVQRDDNLRTRDAVDDTQGPHRLARARHWCTEVEEKAKTLGIAPRISLRVLQGCGHSFVDCVLGGGLDRDFIRPAARCAACRKAGACASAPSIDVNERTAA
jgi:pimeloyl-ACP methyl ester carboxylesterase